MPDAKLSTANAVIRAIAKHQPCNIQSIINETGLSRATVTPCVEIFILSGHIDIAPETVSRPLYGITNRGSILKRTLVHIARFL